MNINGLILLAVFFVSGVAGADNYWMELRANNKYERTELIEKGFDIVAVEEDRVIVLGAKHHVERAEKMGILISRYAEGFSPFDFPSKDEKFSSYAELTAGLKSVASYYPTLVQLSSIGQTVEKRDIWAVRISAQPPGTAGLPASILMGGHHAREHVSVEVPLRMIQYLLQEYSYQNPRIVSLLNNYEIFFVPAVNPDGKEFDIATGKYQYWRKNRRSNGGSSYGVDLNRNYGFGWGGGGASTSINDETYRGPSAFSENETQIIKNFVEAHPNITTLLSFHTYSQLVLWPWGHQDNEIMNQKDLQVFKTMGNKMAKWNGYKPMQSSDLYVASGDTCDWAYGEHGIFAFTFELDPSGNSFGGGGFYPGQGILDSVFNKNIEPMLYLIESSADPYSAK